MIGRGRLQEVLVLSAALGVSRTKDTGAFISLDRFRRLGLGGGNSAGGGKNYGTRKERSTSKI